MVTVLTSPQNNVKAKATAKTTITKAKAKATNPKATATSCRSVASPDNAQRMNEHYFYEALKYSQPI